MGTGEIQQLEMKMISSGPDYPKSPQCDVMVFSHAILGIIFRIVILLLLLCFFLVFKLRPGQSGERLLESCVIPQ